MSENELLEGLTIRRQCCSIDLCALEKEVTEIAYGVGTARRSKTTKWMVIAWIWAEAERMLLQEAMFQELLCIASKARLFYLWSPSTGPFMFSYTVENLQWRSPSSLGFSFFSNFPDGNCGKDPYSSWLLWLNEYPLFLR